MCGTSDVNKVVVQKSPVVSDKGEKKVIHVPWKREKAFLFRKNTF